MGNPEKPEPDLGMLFIPELHVLCKIHEDRKGLYIHLPVNCGKCGKHGESKKKSYLLTQGSGKTERL
jgi:hypothetical protein